MRHLRKISVVFRFIALTAICGCSEHNSAYIGDAKGFQPPDDRTAVPLRCNDSDPIPFDYSTNPFRWGNVQVDINVDVVADFRCPYCFQFAQIMDAIGQKRSDFRDRVRVTFHHFPNESIHPGTTEIHVASAAVAKQGFDLFWLLHDAIFARAAEGEKMDRAALEQFVEQELDLDFDRYRSDVEADETKNFVQWDKEQCRAAGVAGTPSVFVCGALLHHRSQLEEIIDEAL